MDDDGHAAKIHVGRGVGTRRADRDFRDLAPSAGASGLSESGQNLVGGDAVGRSASIGQSEIQWRHRHANPWRRPGTAVSGGVRFRTAITCDCQACTGCEH